MQIFFPLTPKFFPSAPNQPDPTFTAGTGTGTFLIDTIEWYRFFSPFTHIGGGTVKKPSYTSQSPLAQS